MIHFLHGPDNNLSRQKLNNLIEQAYKANKEILKKNGLNLTLNEVILAMESKSLFEQKKLVIIENLFSRPKAKTKDEIIKYLKNPISDLDLIFWEKKEISGTTTRWLPKNWQFEVFKTPAIIFKLLDSLKSNNQQYLLNLLSLCIKKDNSEMVFYMLTRRIRELIIALDLGRTGLKGAPWQIGKLINQASNFSLEKLTMIYRSMLKIDIDIKTGANLMTLDWHLDVLLASL